MNESNVSASQEFTQELEMNLDNMMQTVIQDAITKPSSMDDTNDDFSILTASMMETDADREEEEDDDTVLEEEGQIILEEGEEGKEDGVITFSRARRGSRGKSLIGQGECDISVISKSVDSVGDEDDDSRSTVPEELNSFSGLDHGALGLSTTSLNVSMNKTGVSASAKSETPNMLRKLRGLNAVSRRQSLNHAAHTPLAGAAGRMSVGMKRMSLATQQLESTTKRLSQRFEQRFAPSDSATKASPMQSVTGETQTQKQADVSSTSFNTSVVKSPGRHLSQQNEESYRDEMLQEFLYQMHFEDMAANTQQPTDTFFDVLMTFSESYNLEDNNNRLVNADTQALFRSEVQSILSEVLAAAIEETGENSSLMEALYGPVAVPSSCDCPPGSRSILFHLFHLPT